MSDRNRRPAEEIGAVLSRAIDSYVDAPPPRKNRKRAIFGTWLLVAGGYGAYVFFASNHIDAVTFISRLVTNPTALPEDILSGVAGWGALMLFATVWLLVGLSGSRGPRDPMTIFWNLIGIAVLAAIIWGSWNAPFADPDERFGVRAFCYASFAALLMSLYLSVRGTGRSAARMVEDQMRQQQRSWRVGKNRQF